VADGFDFSLGLCAEPRWQKSLIQPKPSAGQVKTFRRTIAQPTLCSADHWLSEMPLNVQKALRNKKLCHFEFFIKKVTINYRPPFRR